MPTTILSSREFNQDVSRAKRVAEDGPVIITDRGQPAYGLMRHDAYRRMAGGGPNILKLLAQPEGNEIQFDPPKMADGIFRPMGVDLLDPWISV